MGSGRGYDSGFGVAVSGANVYVTGGLENSTANANNVLFGATGTAPGAVVVHGASPMSSIDLVLAKYTDNGAAAALAWTQVAAAPAPMAAAPLR